MEKKAFEALPTNVSPTHYDLRLIPDMRHANDGGTYTFKGTVDVDLDVIEDGVVAVRCNSVEIDVQKASIKQGAESQECKVAFQPSEETVTFSFAKPLKKGSTAVLSIDYTGQLNDKLKGFYRSFYKDKTGKEKMLATTQMEATDCRRALPCWDEPARKAVFSVTMTAPKDLQAVSNMEVIAQKDVEGDLVEYKYAKTPIMSSYLLAFVVGELEYIEAVDVNGIVIRVYTTHGKSEQGRFGLDVAVKCLPFYCSYFEIPYPLKKLDLLAIPDFASGAMENFGCVTYRETALLIDPEASSQANKQWVALVVCHELAHQWFGNLVTMQWWTHLWLNEGFATWVEYLATNKIFPQWDIWTQFINLDLGRALSLDALDSSHPVEVDVGHPSEVDQIFDIISYSKGSCVIRMLVEFLGQEPFRQGLVKYLKKHLYGNATTEDLWSALEQHTGKPVKQVMATWTKQTGYPIVTVTEWSDKHLLLSQKRFFSSGAALTEENRKQTWGIPIRAIVAGKEQHKSVTMLQEDKEVKLDLGMPKNELSFVKLNAEQTGHYRVRYTEELLDRLIKALASGDKRLVEAERLGIQADAFALTNANELPIGQLFRVIGAYGKERSFTVWSDLTNNLSKIGHLVNYTNFSGDFEAFGRDLYREIYGFVGWDKKANEDDVTSLLRTTVVGAFLKYGDKDAVSEAEKRFDKFYGRFKADAKANELASILLPDLRANVFHVVVQNRGESGYDQVMEIYKTTELHEEKHRALVGLTGGTDKALITKAWEFSFSADVRTQDLFIGLASCVRNKHGAYHAWDLFKRDFDEINKRVGESFQMSRIVKSFEILSDAKLADDYEAFFKEHPVPAADRAVMQCIESIRSNSDWLKRDEVAIKRFLKDRK